MFGAPWDAMQTVEDVSFCICLQIYIMYRGLTARTIVVFDFHCQMIEADAYIYSYMFIYLSLNNIYIFIDIISCICH